MQAGAGLKTRKKIKFKKRYWLLIDLAIVIFIIALFLYKPRCYDPPRAVNDNQVSQYLTHVLYQDIYNGSQRQEPFDLIVTQKGINDVIVRSEWPKQSDGIIFSAPAVLFVPDRIILMGTVVLKGVELVVTIVGNPILDEEGLLNLRVVKVKIGAMNITFLARMMAERIYRQQLATTDVDIEDRQAQIAASLLNDEPFEPVFEIDDKRVRVEEITIGREKLTIRMVPAYD